MRTYFKVVVCAMKETKNVPYFKIIRDRHDLMEENHQSRLLSGDAV